mgnify:CR=1 FL=1
MNTLPHAGSAPASALVRSAVACAECDLYPLCLPRGLNREQQAVFCNCIRQRRRLGRGAVLYHAGQPARSIYAVRSGTLKTFTVSSSGEEIVAGFHLPGELIGLEALSQRRRDDFAVALEAVEYCEIRVHEMLRWLPKIASLQRDLPAVVAGRLTAERRQASVHNRLEARRRVAAFIADLASRSARGPVAGGELKLGMDRRDIANYLGMTIETVSRSLHRLQNEGLLKVHGKRLAIPDHAALAGLAGLGPA